MHISNLLYAKPTERKKIPVRNANGLKRVEKYGPLAAIRTTQIVYFDEEEKDEINKPEENENSKLIEQKEEKEFVKLFDYSLQQ